MIGDSRLFSDFAHIVTCYCMKICDLSVLRPYPIIGDGHFTYMCHTVHMHNVSHFTYEQCVSLYLCTLCHTVHMHIVSHRTIATLCHTVQLLHCVTLYHCYIVSHCTIATLCHTVHNAHCVIPKDRHTELYVRVPATNVNCRDICYRTVFTTSKTVKILAGILFAKV